MNNINNIFDFIKGNAQTKLLVNQVSEEVGAFYRNLLENAAFQRNIKLNYRDNFTEEKAQNLFGQAEIDMYFSNNKKSIEKLINSNNKCIIFTDYKNFKAFSNYALTINGYMYDKDIKYYIENTLNIKNTDIIDFCITTPHLTFSEISKYLVNSSSYVRDKKIREINNFILNTRKELFNLKNSKKNIKEIYINLKKEIKYKKFSFLIY